MIDNVHISCRDTFDTNSDGWLQSAEFERLVKTVRRQQRQVVVVAAEEVVDGRIDDIIVEDCEETIDH